jgi:hypothetical protein
MPVYLADNVQRGYTHVAGLYKWASGEIFQLGLPINGHLPAARYHECPLAFWSASRTGEGFGVSTFQKPRARFLIFRFSITAFGGQAANTPPYTPPKWEFFFDAEQCRECLVLTAHTPPSTPPEWEFFFAAE